MTFKRAIPVLVAMVLVVTSQTAATQDDVIPIDAAYKAAVIDSVCAALSTTYVFEDVAKQIETALRNHLKHGDYDKIDALRPFVAALTDHMTEVADDKHLWVQVPPEEELRIARGEVPPEELDPTAREAFDNFGFEKVERMDDNVGYLKLDGFYDASRAHETAVAAMNFLAHCDALIIDLRENGGGSPTMIQLLSSYFFDEPVHLNSFYFRGTDETQQFWTYAAVSGERMTDTPLFILTSLQTFSAAEEFSYNLKYLERALLIGETTGGGAHPNTIRFFTDLNVALSIPYGRAINPITHTNWEKVGVEPHIPCAAVDAVDIAIIEALKSIQEQTQDPQRLARIAFNIERLEALRNPAEITPDVLQRWVGSYGPRNVFLEDGELWYQRDGNSKYRLVAITDTLFCFEQIEYFKLGIETDSAGAPVALVGYYRDGRTDRSPRDTE